jgi:hypothetical protein
MRRVDGCDLDSAGSLGPAFIAIRRFRRADKEDASVGATEHARDCQR